MKSAWQWASIYCGAFLGAFFLTHLILLGIDSVIPGTQRAVPKSTNTEIVEPKPLFEPGGLIWKRVVPDVPWPARDSHGTFLFNDKIWITGGLSTNIFNEEGKPRYDVATYFNDIWSSNDGTRWELVTSGAEFPRIRSISVVLFRGALYLFGGWSPDVGYDVGIWRSFDGAHWELLSSTSPWGRREGFQVVVHNDQLWLFGGVNYDEQKTFNDIWSSRDGLNWELVTANAPWSPRWDYGGVSYQGKLYVVGGMNTEDVGFDDVWASEDGATWSQLLSNAPWGKRQGQALVVYKDMLWLVGGLTADTNNGIGDTWYSDNGYDWQKTVLDREWSGREDHGVLVFDDSIWILGGMNTNWEWNNEVWYSSFVPAA